jgi:AraC-like DNA-binding protein
MKKACQLLAETKLPISQIALDSGFPNPKHFATSFRKQFGKSPSEFRNQLQS